MKTTLTRSVRYVLTLIFLTSMGMVGYGQTLTTDSADYQPGSTCTITGSGFWANESVSVQVHHADGTPDTGADHLPWSVTTDGNGHFVTTWHVCTDDCVNSVLGAMATGSSSGLGAYVEFTDAGPNGPPVNPPDGGACITSVISENNHCVQSTLDGPNQVWDIQEGGIYLVTLSNATDVGNGGTDLSILVNVINSDNGNTCNIVANQFPPYVAGVYTFEFTMPANACNTYPVRYGVTDCNGSSGLGAKAANCLNDGHLRAAIFDGSCIKTANDVDCQQITCIPPSVSSCNGGGTLGCNPTSLPPAVITPTFEGTNATATYTDVTSNIGCSYTLTRTWTITGDCTPDATCDQVYTYTVDNDAPSITCAPDVVQCDNGSNCITLTQPTVSDGCNNGVSVSHSPAITCYPVGTTVITWTATDGCGNSATCSQTVTINPRPNVSIGPAGPISACESQDCVTLTASGADSYLWSPTGETTASVDVCAPGSYSYSVIGTINATGCSSSAGPVSVTIHPNPTCGIDPLQYDANNNNSWDESELPVANSTNNSIVATYIAEPGSILVWSSSNLSWPITGGQGTATVYFTAGPIGTSATFTLTVHSPYNCTSTCEITFSTEVHEQCAYTQGFYGSTNGQMTCIGLTAVPAIQQALGCPYQCTTTGSTPYSTCNPIVVGQGSRKVTVNCNTAAAICLNAKMPSSGSPSALPNASVDICNATGNTWLNNQNRLKNTLLGQAIALNLNIRLFAGLGNLHITTSSFTTYGRVPGDCDPTSTSFVASNVVTKTIPQSVINCLGSNSLNNTVLKLRDLANRALGYTGNGNPTCAALLCTGTCTPPTFSDITAALTAINEGFDACRFMSGFNVRMDEVSSALLDGSTTMVVYPNPATDVTSIEFLASGTGNATVNVYNLSGSLMSVLFNESVTEGSAYKMNFNTTTLSPGIYFVRLNIGGESTVSKLVVMGREK